MRSLQPLRTRTTWLAIVVLMWAALLPSLAMAARSWGAIGTRSVQALTLELCSSRTARLDRDGSRDPSPDAPPVAADCVWCQHHAAPLAVPPPVMHLGLALMPQTALLVPSTSDVLLPPGRAPPHDAPPRAPPSLLS